MSTLQENNQNGLVSGANKGAQDLVRNVRDLSSSVSSILRTTKSKAQKFEVIERTKDRVEIDEYHKSLPQDQQPFCQTILDEIAAFD
tara:strand:- start:129 stop:389 length:261 start_codon:yes stop_codon:yes gene_type:complete